jgi:cytoskeletal protein RodZ
MRRRRKRNRGVRWTIALIVVAVLGYVGLQYWKGGWPMRQAAQEATAMHAPGANAGHVVTQPAPLPPAGATTVRPTTTATFMSEAEARDAAARAAREQTLKVQQMLREQNRAREHAAARPSENERCINGQKMKRVDNGWVQAGDC